MFFSNTDINLNTGPTQDITYCFNNLLPILVAQFLFNLIENSKYRATITSLLFLYELSVLAFVVTNFFNISN